MSTISQRVTAALDQAEDAHSTTQARSALAEYEAHRTAYYKDNLLVALSLTVGDDQAMDLLRMKPPHKGLVWCCSAIGWVTPQERADHRWDAYSDMD